MVEAPRRHRLAHQRDLRLAGRVEQPAKRRFGGEEVRPEGLLAPVGVADEAGAAVAVEDYDRAASGPDRQALGLDQRLPAERRAVDLGADLRHASDLHRVGEILPGGLVAQRDRQADPRRFALPPPTGLERRLHAALRGEVAVRVPRAAAWSNSSAR